jgi:hypothetical protein
MTDYRDPNYRDPNYRNPNRDPDLADQQSWSGATWGWIAGIAIVVLVLVFAFGNMRDTSTTATDTSNPPASTVGQGSRALPDSRPSTPPAGPTMNRPEPAPAPASPPAPENR